MESIGDKLRIKREEMGVSVEQVARDTNITKSYLVALENEKFDDFPGETYLVGFLRNYSEYLGLSADDMISLYKSFKIQEQPVPMDELLEKARIPGWTLVVLGAVVVIALVTGVFIFSPELFSTAVVSESVPVQRTVVPETQKPNVLSMDEDILEQRFMQGTTISFVKDNVTYEMLLESIDKDITIKSGDNRFILALGQEERLDLDNSGDPDIYVLIRDIDGNAGVIRFDRQVITAAAVPAEPDVTEAVSLPEVNIGAAQISSRARRPVVILSDTKAAPFALTVIFRGYCLVRYISDDQERIEKYFRKDDVLKLDVQRQLRLWFSNAGNVSAKIGGKDVLFGKPGEVTSSLIRWEQDNGNQELTLVPVY